MNRYLHAPVLVGLGCFTAHAGSSPPPLMEVPPPPAYRYDEAHMLPLRSTRLTPGDVERRPIRAPGLPPLFVIGDDARSRAWLQQRLPALRDLNAVGLAVQVDSPAALAALRRLAPGLTISPVSGDELAQRLGLHHYPALITSNAIEQ